jgi:hypothetical protein
MFLALAVTWHAWWVFLSIFLGLAAIWAFSGESAARSGAYDLFQSSTVIAVYGVLGVVPNLLLAVGVWRIGRAFAPLTSALLGAAIGSAIWSLLAAAFAPPVADSGVDPGTRLGYVIGGALTGSIYGALLGALAGRRGEIPEGSEGQAPRLAEGRTELDSHNKR